MEGYIVIKKRESHLLLCSAWCKLMLRAANYANEMQRNLPWYDDHASQMDRSDSSDDNSSFDGAKGKAYLLFTQKAKA